MKKILSFILSICVIFSIIGVNVFAEEEIISGEEKYFVGNENLTLNWSFNCNTGVLTVSGEGVLFYATGFSFSKQDASGLWVTDKEKISEYNNKVKTLVIEGFSDISRVNLEATPNIETIYIPKELVRMSGPGGNSQTIYDRDVFEEYGGYYERLENLKEFIVDPNNPTFKSIDGVLYTKDMEFLEYPYGKQDEVFTVPEDIRCYNEGIISIYSPNLKKVVVPDNVGAFEFNTNADLYIYSKSAYGFGDTTYMYEDSEAYSYACDRVMNYGYRRKIKLVDGKLSETGTYGDDVIWQYDGSSKTLRVSGTGAMDDGSLQWGPYWQFYYDEIESVVIETGISHIGDIAFEDYKQLNSLVIPKSVTSIGNGAFAMCDNLTDIYYEGAQNEWNNISIGYYNESLKNATMHYNHKGNIDSSDIAKANLGEEKVKEATTGWKFDPVRQLILTIGDNNATIFGEQKTNDVAPIIRNERTMLPIRFIAEALGAEVNWDSKNKIVTITNGDIIIEITIDKSVAIVNGKEIALDSPAFIESDRTFLPLRFVSENLGAEVDWIEDTRQVVITKPIEE